MVHIITKLIRFYQKLSPVFLTKSCRFHPSCSQYTLEAVEKYGICKGLARSFGRILRCSPLSPGGYDPVR